MNEMKFIENIEECNLDYEDALVYFDDDETVLQEGIGAEDAQYLSRNKYGYINLPYMSKISGLTEECLVRELKGRFMWQNPANPEEWLTREQMSQGNLYDALKQTEKENQRNGAYKENIKLLKEMLPEAPEAEEIEMSLASPWIPLYLKKQFLMKITNMLTPPKMEIDEYYRKCRIEPGIILDDFNNRYKYGTSRISCVKIIEKTINAVPIIIHDSIERYDKKTPDYVVNEGETQLAREKQAAVHEVFKQWIHDDPDMEENLRKIYTEKYCYTVCRYDGSYLTLPGLNPDVVLYRHQKNAIERVIASGKNIYLAHNVGAGKTYIFEIGVHELLRMGICKKAVIVVPNQVLDATVEAWKHLYPDEKFLAVYPKDFTPAKRAGMIQKMKEEDCHLVFIAYSSFNMLTMSRQYYLDKKHEEIQRCQSALNTAKSHSSQKALRNALERMSKDYLKMMDELKDTAVSCFDSMGFDCLVVDEAHNYKNISLDFRLDGIIGMHARGSKKADEMLEKVHHIGKQGGKVIFASGTPITNSLADLYVIQKYLQYDELQTLNIAGFGEWISTFGEQDTNFESTLDMNYQFVTRFSQFHNLPELMALFSNVCDFYQIDEKDMKLPDMEESIVVKVERSEEQKCYMEHLVERTEDIHNHMVKRKEDNLLKVTVDGRLASLDMRHKKPDAVVTQTDNKVKVCAGKAYGFYTEYPGTTQIIFCDVSTPKKEFNVYDELKKEMIACGIPEYEIAFIHDAATEAKRSAMFKEFNKGKIRILIGSTQKLGTGCNVQEKLIAIHNLDVPWRPADREQRKGRILRQGNQNSKVYELDYCTEGTLDAFSYQKLESKQRFISSFLSGMLDPGHRSAEDIADAVLTYAEIKAAAIGNPLIKTRVEVSNELEHTKTAYRQRKKELTKLQNLILGIPDEIRRREGYVKMFAYADKHYKTHKEVIKNEEREAFGKELLEALQRNIHKENERIFDWYQGFEVVLPENMDADDKYIILREGKSSRYPVKMNTDKPMGCSKRIDYTLERFHVRKTEEEEKIEVLKHQMEEAKRELNKGNPHFEKLELLKKRLQEIDEKLEEDAA